MSTFEYICPDCGANSTFLPKDCCDTCILKFFVEDETEPALTDIDPR